MEKKLPMIGFCLIALAGCSGSDEPQPVKNETNAISVTKLLSIEQLDQSWVVRMANDQNRTAFEGDPGWTAYFNRNYAEALDASSGTLTVRMHLEHAAVYSQAVSIHSNATAHVYGTDRQAEDPDGTYYVVGLSKVFQGNFEEAATWFGKLNADSTEPSNVSINARVETWNRWVSGLQSDAEPPLVRWSANNSFEPITDDTTVYPSTPAPVIKVPLVDDALLTLSDATDLWNRSRWHQRRAATLMGTTNAAEVSSAWLAPWALAVEKRSANSAKLLAILESEATEVWTDEWLFLSPYLTSRDVHFVAGLALHSSSWSDIDREEKLASFLKTSDAEQSAFLAKLLAASFTDNSQQGKAKQERELVASRKGTSLEDSTPIFEYSLSSRILDTDTVMQLAGELEQQLLKRMKETTGSEQPFFLMFADFAEQALLRAGAAVAAANGQYRDAGVLMLAAKDSAQPNSKDPKFWLSTAAWDVGNRYPTRAQDIVHQYSQDFPALKEARAPLDSLQIRIGKTSAAPGASH